MTIVSVRRDVSRLNCECEEVCACCVCEEDVRGL